MRSDQFKGVDTKLPTSLYAVDALAIPEIKGSVSALRIRGISDFSTPNLALVWQGVHGNINDVR